MMDLVKEFKKEIKEKEIRGVERRRKKRKERELNPEVEFKRSKLLGKYMAKILFRWNNERFEDEYLKKLEKS